MHWYAETPTRRYIQIGIDLLMAGWIFGWVTIGIFAHDALNALAVPADSLRVAGSSLEDRMTTIATTIGDVPLVGDDLTTPFTGVAGVGGNLVSAGDSLETSVNQIALWAGLAIGGIPIIIVFALWLTLRIRYTRRAARLAAVRSNPEFVELLALRGLVNTRVDKLNQFGPELIQAWRDGDPQAQRHLANHELRRVGLKPCQL